MIVRPYLLSGTSAMTQLRNLFERIESGSGPSLGFGSVQPARLPGMALIGRCSGDLDAALVASAEAADAVVIFAPGLLPDALPDLASRIWGAGGAPLQPEIVEMWRAAGADFTVSPFASAVVDAINIAEPQMTHGARIPDDVDDRTWRILGGVPLDFLVLDKSSLTGPWTFADLGQAADAAHRTDKYLVVRVGPQPTANELLALRQAGAVAIVAEANDLGADGMASLKSDLMALPRLQHSSRRRIQPGQESPAT